MDDRCLAAPAINILLRADTNQTSEIRVAARKEAGHRKNIYFIVTGQLLASSTLSTVWDRQQADRGTYTQR